MDDRTFVLTNPEGTSLAELFVEEDGEGWFTGRAVVLCLPADVRRVLSWYDEVANNQMLSYLDQAQVEVDRLGLTIISQYADVHRIERFQLSQDNSVVFKIDQVRPPN